MESKQLLFILLTLGFVPTATWMGITFRWAEKALVAGAFFSTAYLIDINFVSMEVYRGDTRGFEFGITDWMILSLLGVMLLSPRWRNRRFTLMPPNSAFLVCYIFLATVSLFNAYVPVYAGFGLMKLIRGFTVFVVAYNYLQKEEDLRFIIYILVGIVALELFVVLNQRMSGIYRPAGTTPHSNTLAGYLNMINMIFFALLLGDKSNAKFYWPVLAAGTVMVLATFSRGAMAAMIFGYVVVIVLSYRHKIDVRKTRILCLIAVLAIPVGLQVGPAIIERFLYAPEESGESRVLANTAAIAMANDHILGVGLNNYSHVINETSYIRFIDNSVDRGIVHNIFLLHACEMGWMGMLVFILLTLNFLRLGLQSLNKIRSPFIGSCAIGLTTAILVLTLQGGLEWFFRQTYITIEFFMLAGFLVALPRLSAITQRKDKVNKLIRNYLWTRDSHAYPSSCAPTTI
jgi:hypothetical protein